MFNYYAKHTNIHIISYKYNPFVNIKIILIFVLLIITKCYKYFKDMILGHLVLLKCIMINIY